MSKKEISLYGAGGHCFAVADLILSLGEYTITDIVDDAPKRESILNIPVKKFNSINFQPKHLFISIGSNRHRKLMSSKFNAVYPYFIHSTVVCYSSVKVGKGTIVHPQVVLDSSVTIGDFCVINNSASISHNTIVEDFVHVAIQVSVAGGVKIGEGTLVGAGSVILPEIKIGKWATIGAGSIVTKDVPDNAVVYGNPARIIKFNDGK